MAEEKRNAGTTLKLTLPKKKDERAEYLAFQNSIDAQKPRDGSLTPEQIEAQTPRPRPNRG